MTTVRKRYIDGLFGQMHLRMTEPAVPDKSPVLCLHASPLSGLIFEDLLARLGKDRIAIAPDTPGYGMSDPPSQPPAISDYANALSRLIDDLNLETVDLVGYATGSVIAAELARQRPGAVRRLVLFSAPVIDDADRQALGDRFGHEIAAQPDGSHLLPLWDQVFAGRGPGQDAALCMLVFPEHIRAQGEKKPWAPLAAFHFELDTVLAKLTQPMVIYNIATEVHGATLRAAPHVPDGTIIELQDFGHGFLQTRPDETDRLIRTVLDTP